MCKPIDLLKYEVYVQTGTEVYRFVHRPHILRSMGLHIDLIFLQVYGFVHRPHILRGL